MADPHWRTQSIPPCSSPRLRLAPGGMYRRKDGRVDGDVIDLVVIRTCCKPFEDHFLSSPIEQTPRAPSIHIYARHRDPSSPHGRGMEAIRTIHGSLDASSLTLLERKGHPRQSSIQFVVFTTNFPSTRSNASFGFFTDSPRLTTGFQPKPFLSSYPPSSGNPAEYNAHAKCPTRSRISRLPSTPIPSQANSKSAPTCSLGPTTRFVS